MPLRSFREFAGKRTTTRFASVGGGRIKTDSLQHVCSEIAEKEKRNRRNRAAKKALKIALRVIIPVALALLLLRYFPAIRDFFTDRFF